MFFVRLLQTSQDICSVAIWAKSATGWSGRREAAAVTPINIILNLGQEAFIKSLHFGEKKPLNLHFMKKV